MADFGYSPQEGVTFYYDNRGKVTDLCINPNVKTVTICSRSSNSFVGRQFSLQDCKKQFPDVEVLRISSDIIDVCMLRFRVCVVLLFFYWFLGCIVI